jgi:hypothetical protein
VSQPKNYNFPNNSQNNQFSENLESEHHFHFILNTF